jgi:hypothetical protein
MRRSVALALLVLPATATACGAAGPAPTAHPVRTTTANPSCARTARGELAAIAQRIYAQAVTGPNEVAAVARLHRSTALTRAVAARDPRAIRAALLPVIHNRIVRIDISAGGRTLVKMGTAPAFAPVRGVIGGGVGRYVLSVGDQHSFEAITRGLTGASVRFGGSGGVSFPAQTFPRAATSVHLALPAQPPVVCGMTAADTRASTIGLVGRNLIYAETKGASAQMALRHAAKTPAFRRAIASASPAAVRAAIIGFFRDSRFHIVRVRAWKGSHLVTDVGGPFVISPATATIPGVGRFMLSVQDDTGYIKLIHRFTGADVVLHAGTQTVPGSNLFPGPPYARGLTTVTYRGHTYRAYGFSAPAFPSGSLHVSLLVP